MLERELFISRIVFFLVIECSATHLRQNGDPFAKPLTGSNCSLQPVYPATWGEKHFFMHNITQNTQSQLMHGLIRS